MKLSVALCTYNGEKYLAEQLTSIMKQTRLPDELIICDDYSHDQTLSIIYETTGSASFPLKLISNEQNLGVSRNFEQAVRLCNGDIIILADQDDIWYSNKLEVIEQVFCEDKENKVGLVFSDADIIDQYSQLQNKRLWSELYFSPNLQHEMRDGKAFQVLLKQNYITGATMAFRSSYREMILPISPQWIHDGWISMILSLITDIRLIDDPLIMYRKHSSNTVGTSKRSLYGWLERTRNTPPEYFSERARAFDDLLQQIDKLDIADSDYVHEEIHHKAKHLHVRAAVMKQGVPMWTLLLREWIRGNYHRYSMGGLHAVIRDIIASI